jgi:uroporphyrinogen decarboxylase
MTSRDIFLKVLDFKKLRRNLKWDFGYWGGVISRWENEGLPKGLEFFGPVRELVYGEFINGPGIPYPMPSYSDDVLFASGISEYFQLDGGNSPFPFNWWYHPRFEKVIINETDEKIEYIDTLGIRRLDFKDERSMPHWLEYPVKNEKDWERLKEERLNLDHFEDRYTVEDVDRYIAETRERDFALLLYGSPIGFFGILRFMIGEPDIYYWYYDQPVLMKSMADYLCGMWLNIAEELTTKIEFDWCYFFEDMAYKQGSLIGPALFREFMAPYYTRLIDFAKSRGIRHHIVDSDGYVEDLVPLFLEVGMTGLQPFEVRAGNDIERLRKNYPKLEILGGIDKTALQSREMIDRELDKVERMLAKGGYIPYVDHAYPPDISYENYRYFREKLNRIVDPESQKA